MRKRMMALVLLFQFFTLWRGWYWTWKWKDSKKSFAKIVSYEEIGKILSLNEKINRFLDVVNSALWAIPFSSWIAELCQAGPTRPGNLWEWCRTGAMQVKEEFLAGSQCKLVQLEAGMLLKLGCFWEEQSPKAPVFSSAFEECSAICELNLTPARAAD